MLLLLGLFLFMPKSQAIDVSFYQVPTGSLQKIILNVSIPSGRLLFEKKDSLFVAIYEISAEIKRNDKIIMSDFWRYKIRTKSYDSTQTKTSKTIIFHGPNCLSKIHLTLLDVLSKTELVDSQFHLKPLNIVSSLIPIDYNAYLKGKKRLVSRAALDEIAHPLFYYRIDKETKGQVKVEFLLKDKKKDKVIWKNWKSLKGPYPTEDTISLPFDSLHSGLYVLEGDFFNNDFKEKRQFTFNLFNLTRLIDQDFNTVLGIISYIASSDELKKFKRAKPEERRHLWKEFWKKRDPTPGTEKNEFEEEYWERVKYANDHFSYSNWPGYRTDRGMIYITVGPPDEIESHPFDIDVYPYEIWYYYSRNLQFLFVDRSGVGEYELVYPLDYRSHL